MNLVLYLQCSLLVQQLVKKVPFLYLNWISLDGIFLIFTSNFLFCVPIPKSFYSSEVAKAGQSSRPIHTSRFQNLLCILTSLRLSCDSRYSTYINNELHFCWNRKLCFYSALLNHLKFSLLIQRHSRLSRFLFNAQCRRLCFLRVLLRIGARWFIEGSATQ